MPLPDVSTPNRPENIEDEPTDITREPLDSSNQAVEVASTHVEVIPAETPTSDAEVSAEVIRTWALKHKKRAVSRVTHKLRAEYAAWCAAQSDAEIKTSDTPMEAEPVSPVKPSAEKPKASDASGQDVSNYQEQVREDARAMLCAGKGRELAALLQRLVADRKSVV